MSTTPDQPQQPEPERPGGEQADSERTGATEAHDALRNLEDKPRSDDVGETAYSAVPPPLPPSGEQQPPEHQQSPYQQQGGGQYAPPGGAEYGAGQYASGQYAGAQQPQYGAAAGGQYAAAPPPAPYDQPQYGQPYGYPPSDLPPGMPPLADWGQRATAFLLDNGVAIAAGWIAGGTRSRTIDVVFGLVGLAGAVWAVLNAVRAGRGGQSYGKRVMGIRLARLADGQPIGGGLGFLRLFLNWLFWVACVIPGVLNLMWPLWDRRNQTWCDKIAKSVVVKTR